MRAFKHLTIFIFILWSVTSHAQSFQFKFSSNGIFNSDGKLVSGYDDGKEFVRTQDLSSAILMLYATNLNISGKLDLNRGRLYITSGRRPNDEFKLVNSDEEDYTFQSNGIIIGVNKRMLRLVILSERVDKRGDDFTYMAVFGQPL